ncbi:MAG: AAA family ATPase [Acholeplasmataceae bacterium]|nr:AAA family ATPase [Acholeplasmataceae bacterium]
MKIYLIGMPGSGKTTIARNLAKTLHHQYIDLDGRIEKSALLFIEEIFESYGETKFRDMETEALRNLPEDNIVVACGGGIVTKNENKTLMRGLIFYLDTDLDTIKKRLETDYQRPLLKKMSLDMLYDDRFLKYQNFADAIVSNNSDVDETVKVIMRYLKERGYL